MYGLTVGGLQSINSQQIVMDRKHMRNGPFATK